MPEGRRLDGAQVTVDGRTYTFWWQTNADRFDASLEQFEALNDLLKPMGIAIVSAVEDARVERLIVRDYPGMRRWFLAPLRRALNRERTNVGRTAYSDRVKEILKECRSPAVAEPLYERFRARLGAQGGVFGAAMAVELVNDGPVTLLLEA